MQFNFPNFKADVNKNIATMRTSPNAYIWAVTTSKYTILVLPSKAEDARFNEYHLRFGNRISCEILFSQFLFRYYFPDSNLKKKFTTFSRLRNILFTQERNQISPK